MSDWREDIERVREALIDVWALDDYPLEAFDALAALTVQMEELERAVSDYMKQSSEQADEARKWRARAEHAERTQTW